jgi:hypothetical protein
MFWISIWARKNHPKKSWNWLNVLCWWLKPWWSWVKTSWGFHRKVCYRKQSMNWISKDPMIEPDYFTPTKSEYIHQQSSTYTLW